METPARTPTENRTATRTETPTPDRTESADEFPVPGCFVATASYGTPTAEEIDVLRDFRDRVLLRNAPGERLVDAYYRYSPPLAAWIARSDRRRWLARELLVEPLVAAVSLGFALWRRLDG
mgnify:CR=1 FL=1